MWNEPVVRDMQLTISEVVLDKMAHKCWGLIDGEAETRSPGYREVQQGEGRLLDLLLTGESVAPSRAAVILL